MHRSSIVICALVITFMTLESHAAGLINCCTNWQECTNACASLHCGYTLCCKRGSCSVGGVPLPVCGCTCVNCPNQSLAASGLLGKSAKFAAAGSPAKFIAAADNQTINVSHFDALNVTKN